MVLANLNFRMFKHESVEPLYYMNVCFRSSVCEKEFIFNAELDDVLLELMHEQQLLEKRGDRGYKKDAYVE